MRKLYGLQRQTLKLYSLGSSPGQPNPPCSLLDYFSPRYESCETKFATNCLSVSEFNHPHFGIEPPRFSSCSSKPEDCSNNPGVSTQKLGLHKALLYDNRICGYQRHFTFDKSELNFKEDENCWRGLTFRIFAWIRLISLQSARRWCEFQASLNARM